MNDPSSPLLCDAVHRFRELEKLVAAEVLDYVKRDDRIDAFSWQLIRRFKDVSKPNTGYSKISCSLDLLARRIHALDVPVSQRTSVMNNRTRPAPKIQYLGIPICRKMMPD
jgi:hypothetical protein